MRLVGAIIYEFNMKKQRKKKKGVGGELVVEMNSYCCVHTHSRTSQTSIRNVA